MKKTFSVIFIMIFFTLKYSGQSALELLIHHLVQPTPIHSDLQELCDEIGGRVTGSKANENAVDWALNKFREARLTAYRDPFYMPDLWLEDETTMILENTEFRPQVVSKYHSPPGVHVGNIIHVSRGNKEELDKLTDDEIKNSFLLIETDICLDIDGLFSEYSHAAKVEFEALKRGARGLIFMSSRPQKLLYRFISARAAENDMPQLVMAREDAKRCIRLIDSGKKLNTIINIKAKTSGKYLAENVIAEIEGSEYPEEVVIIGAHLDSWALGTGANDNGANVCMMIDIARQMKKLNIKPKRTIRFALWNGEEQGYFGSWSYTKDQLEKLDSHVMALSVDIGSGAITGFFTNGREELITIIDSILVSVEEYGPFHHLNIPIVGTDNFDFMMQGVPNLVGIHKPQLYGPNYHASSDTYDKVDIEQLKINSAIVAALTYGFANMKNTIVKLPRQNRTEIQQIIDEHNLEFTLKMFNVWDSWVEKERGRK